ncbi:MAG TPA: tRNA (N6-isopentenyl adenosine(37)-C2)-methylthiotransferase MiaB [Mollicutes bacterium]|nr:tRNA (N6-isopentenyl adenosine(37)-C2)-methylthiotransferase MiaB [Mollicutes bacterium]
MRDAAKRFKKAEYIYENRTNQRIYEGKTYYIRTYGCQMNVHDSEEIKGLLETLGFSESKVLEKSDFIILNTCAIRENAHDKVFGFLGRLKHLKEKNPELLIGLCGCMAQEESVVKEIKERHPYIDIVFGTHNISEVPTMLEKYSGKQKISVYSKEGDVIEFDNLYKRDSNITAFVNIMYGCDKFCTYCIVPYTRGKERSRLSKDIIKEIKDLKENGYKEVTLLGQNVNAYGKDLEDSTTFSNLLEMVSKTGIERIRFVTSHPWDFTDEMIDVISKYDNIMPYIHLPVQSGSNNILRLMNRRYTKEEYLTLFNKLKSKVKNASITTDIIVGFPGETEEDFKETLDLVNKCKFDGAFTFIFSAREGTPASKMKDNTTLEEKNKRLQSLNKLINKYSKESNLKTLGTIQKVLITGISEKDKDKITGYTETMKLVNVKGSKENIGKIIDVKIIDAKSFSLDGEEI